MLRNEFIEGLLSEFIEVNALACFLVVQLARTNFISCLL